MHESYNLKDAQDLEEKQLVMHRSADKEGQRERREKKEKAEAAAAKARLKAETATYVAGEDTKQAAAKAAKGVHEAEALDARGQSPHGPSGPRDDDKIIYTELSSRAAAWTCRCNAESS